MIPSPDLALLDSAAKDALIRTLIERLNDLTVRLEVLEAENAALRKENAELRIKLDLPPKTPDNSSTPPSQGHKASGAADAKPKAKPHAGAHRPLHPNPTQRRDVPASQCQHCRADVSGVMQTPVHSYDRIEIPEIKPDVTRVAWLGGMCPCCAKPFKAAPPAGLEPGSPFGPNLRAFAIYLRFTQAISFERLSRLFSDLLGLEISEGALVNMLDDSKQAFARAANLIRARLLAGTILQSDETSVRVGKRTWWTWVFHHAEDACFVIHPNRSRAVVEQFLGEHRPDFWVSDRLAAQMNWAKKDHQVCLAHLIRDAQYAIDAELDVLLRITPAHGAGNKLQGVIKGCRRYLFVFLANRAIPPTNNGSDASTSAQQALRPCVIFRKVTNCFRSEWAAQRYADIRSVIETARRRTIGALQAIRLTLNGLHLPAALPPLPSG